jgi:hypothetical protein
MSFLHFISILKKNSIFNFFSSVRLAVPLMLILVITAAFGTIYESQYNSEYAKLLIYNSNWFLFLLILLWLNIFCATISRIPYKKHHTGFVITHIGLLSLLGGAFVTSSSGIDGQLQVREKNSENRIILSELELGYQFDDSHSKQSIIINKKLSPQDSSQLKELNKEFEHLFTVEKYIPFARFDRIYETTTDSQDNAIALSFILKSSFFNVSEWLHTESVPTLNMGPATLKVFFENEEPKQIRQQTVLASPQTQQAKVKKPRTANSEENKLILKNTKTHEVVKSLSITEFRKSGVTINGYKITLVNQFTHAIVRENKLSEGDGENANPALEISISKDGKSTRDILYAKFPEFSLRKDNSLGLDLSYQATLDTGGIDTNNSANTNNASHSNSASNENLNENSTTNNTQTASSNRQGNTIEFYLNPKNPKQARVELYKNQNLVGKEWLNPGQSYQTPWMGITITIGAIIQKAKMRDSLTEIGPEKGKDLPPSAILIRLKNSDEKIWLAEGETKQFGYNSRSLSIFYGRQIIQLPFSIGLDKFSKINYPGTETPLSFESMVHVNEMPNPIKISMNEPLKLDSFTLYQSSYILNPGETPVSIFSVNKDPGRPIKYIGSLILCLGIVVFTLMRSRYGKSKAK